MKKLITMLLAVMLVMGLAMPAMAQSLNGSISTVSDEKTELIIYNQQDDDTFRSFEAYQILYASVSGEAFAYELNQKYEEVLKTVTKIEQPGTSSGGVQLTIGETIIQYISNIKTAEGMTTFANDLYREIQKKGLDSDTQWEGTTAEVTQGYYLIVDKTELEGEERSNSLVMIDTVGDAKVEITVKGDFPSLVKKVDDENDSRNDPRENNEDAAVWRDSADYDIGDDVPFHITVNLPNNLTSYNYYAIRIEDKIEQGLEFLPETFKIRVGPNGTESTVSLAGTEGADWVYSLSEDRKTLSVYPNKSYINNAGETISPNSENGGNVKTITGAGNDVNIIFTYKCRLTEDAVVGEAGNPNYANLKFSNDPYGDQWGETPNDVNVVFTYKTVINKVNTDGNELRGADFDLYKFIPDDNGADTHNDIKGNWSKLENHKTTNAVADDPETEANEALGASMFTFTGLDDGIYKLVERKVPAGYNGAEDIYFEVTAEHDIEFDEYSNTGLLTSVNGKGETTGMITFTSSTADGSLTASIENRSGLELPHTGGIGTTIFYVVGAVLAVGALVLLVTKKRMAE